MTVIESPGKRALDHQIAGIGWALLFIMTGGLMLLPNVPRGTWLIGAGLILLGAQGARLLNQLPMRTFSLVLGIFAIVLGGASFAGVDLPVFPILLILIGLAIVLPSRVGGERVS